MFSVINSGNHVNANIVKQSASLLTAEGQGTNAQEMLAFPGRALSHTSAPGIENYVLVTGRCLMKVLSFGFPVCHRCRHFTSFLGILSELEPEMLPIIWCDRNYHGSYFLTEVIDIPSERCRTHEGIAPPSKVVLSLAETAGSSLVDTQADRTAVRLLF